MRGRGSAGSTSRSLPTAASCSSRVGSSDGRCRGRARRSSSGVACERRLGVAGGVVRCERSRRVVVDLGKLDREHRIGERYRHVVLVVDDRERFAPVTLPAEQPVPQPVSDCTVPVPGLFEPVNDVSLCLGDAQSLEAQVAAGGADHLALARVRLTFPVVGGLDGPDDRKRHPLGEVPVPLVLAGHAHDRAGAVAHQHVVRDEHGDLPSACRVARIPAGPHPGRSRRLTITVPTERAGHDLAVLRDRIGGCRCPRRPCLPRPRRPRAAGELVDGGMMGRQHKERRAEDRLRPGREDIEPAGR